MMNNTEHPRNSGERHMILRRTVKCGDLPMPQSLGRHGAISERREATAETDRSVRVRLDLTKGGDPREIPQEPPTENPEPPDETPTPPDEVPNPPNEAPEPPQETPPEPETIPRPGE